MTKVVATIEARRGASRLPDKVLQPVLGEPMLARIIERVKRARRVDAIVVATTQEVQDDAVAELAGRCGVGVHRGPTEDVLARVVGAAQSASADAIVELMGDNPFADPAVIDELVAVYQYGAADYVANLPARTYPLGIDTQVFGARLLVEIAATADAPEDREHVTTYIYRNPDRFKLVCVEAPPTLRRPAYRLTVDEAVDLELTRLVYEALHPTKPDFGLTEVIAYLDANPDVAAINGGVAHRWVSGAAS